MISSREGSLSSDHLPLLPHHSTKVGSYDDQGVDDDDYDGNDDDDGDDGGGVNDDEAKALKIGKRKGKRLKVKQLQSKLKDEKEIF